MNEENRKPRVVIDTNLVISGTISSNIPSQLLTFWSQGKFDWILTEETYNELEEVLNRESIRKTYRISKTETKSFLENLSVGAEFVPSIAQEFLPIHSRDPKDDKILACALGGNCDYLITSDEDLLILNDKPPLGKLKIIKAADFLQASFSA